MADCMHLEVWQRRSNCWIGFIVVNWSQRIWDCAILTGENLKHGIQRSQMILCKISWCSFYLGAEMISVPYSLIKCLVAFLTFSYDYCMFWICCVPFEISQLLIVTSVMISILASIVAAMAESQTFGCLEFFGRKHDPWILQILGFDIDKGDESFGIWSQFSVEYNVTKILSTAVYYYHKMDKDIVKNWWNGYNRRRVVLCLFSTVMQSPGPAYQGCTGVMPWECLCPKGGIIHLRYPLVAF